MPIKPTTPPAWKLILACLFLIPLSDPCWAGEAILIGAGDIVKCGGVLKNAEATAKLIDEQVTAAQSAESNPDPQATPELVVFTLGDHAYPKATAKRFQKCYEPTWGRHKDRTRPSPGNHDYRVKGAAPYFDYFGEAAGEPGKGYYSYNLGDWRIIVLNSCCKRVEGGCAESSPQYQWLLEELRNNSRPCSLAYFHHPLFSSGFDGSIKRMKPFYQAMNDAGVDVVLSGHDHHYERFAPQDPDGNLDPEHGIRQFIVGTGGRGKRFFEITGINPKKNSEVAKRALGVLRLNLHPESYDWEFHAIPGNPLQDSGSGTCH